MLRGINYADEPDEFENREEVRLKKEIELLENFKNEKYDKAIDRELLVQMIQTVEKDERRLSQGRPTRELTRKHKELKFLKSLLVLIDPTLLN